MNDFMKLRRPKGSGTIETTPEGLYRARFPFTPGRRDEVGTFASYEEAGAALDGILAEMRSAGGVRGIALRKLGARVLDMREKEGYRSVDSERNRWRNYVESWDLADAPVSTLTRGDIRSWLAHLAGLGLAVQTRRNALNLLRVVLAAGVDDGHLEENVAFGLRVKARGSVEETSTWLSREESEALIAASGLDPAVILAITTGLRQGELRSLLWEDVHENHLVVRFGAPGKPTKSGKIRHVPLLPQARAALDAIADRKHRMVLPTVNGFFRPKGRIVDAQDWTAWLNKAGIKRRVRWHDLRHTCATLLLTGAWGAPWTYEAVKEMLGHSSVKVTERYAKATGSLADRAARAMRKPRTSPGRRAPKDGNRAESLRGADRIRTDVSRFCKPNQSPNSYECLAHIVGLARAYVDSVELGDPFAHRHGLALAAAVLDAVDEDVAEVGS